MLLILRDSEHLQVWPDDAFAEQVDMKSRACAISIRVSSGCPLLDPAQTFTAACAMTFNHGVEGSSPSALTK